MSKAFTSEETPDTAVLGRPARPPSAIKRPITPEGHAALVEELRRLTEVERPALRAREDADAVGARAALEHRVGFVLTTLDGVEVVTPPRPDGAARFGSVVRVEDESGGTRTLRIVGPDEADAAEGRVSTESPLARALLGRRAGDEVELRTPRGVVVYAVMDVDGWG